jgi:hypothetical protein
VPAASSWRCRSSAPSRRVPPQARDTLPHSLDTLHGGSFRLDGLRTRTRLVVRDSITWDSLWTRLTADRIILTRGDSLIPVQFPLPAVDFSRDMLIVVSRGEMPSLQYGTRIERVRVSGRELRVDVCNWHPSRDAVQFWTDRGNGGRVLSRHPRHVDRRADPLRPGAEQSRLRRGFWRRHPRAPRGAP